MDTKTTTTKNDFKSRPTKTLRPAGAGGKGGFQKREGGRGGKGAFIREKPEFDQKILTIRRVTRVVAGGRRMGFSVAMAIGDKKGSIGFGIGKAGDTALAINKALRVAKKNMIRLKTNDKMSISHQVDAKFCSSSVTLMPNGGRGLVAGSVIRDMLTLGGIKHVTSKIHSGSKNKLNNAQATMKALAKIARPYKKEMVVSVEQPKAEILAKVASIDDTVVLEA